MPLRNWCFPTPSSDSNYISHAVIVQATSCQPLNKSESVFTEGSPNARWRIENILPNGPPTEKDWWKIEQVSHVSNTNSYITPVEEEEKYNCSSFDALGRSPTSILSIHEDRNINAVSNCNIETNYGCDSSTMCVTSRKFFNIGRECFDRAQAEWRQSTVAHKCIPPYHPPIVTSEAAVRNLLTGGRLEKMSLASAVEILSCKWESEHDFD